MNPDVRLGRIAGVEVAASWSLLVIVGLITWSLGAAVLPGAAPGAPAVAVWVTSAVTAVAFFACLLAHELAHSVVARSAGMEVDGIVLWMFGGVSRLAGDAPDARTEQRMAIAGPRASAGLCIGLLGLAALVGAGRSTRRGRGRRRLAGLRERPAGGVQPAPRLPPRRRTGAARDRLAPHRRPAPGHGRGRRDRDGLRLRLMGLGALVVLAGDGLGGIWLALLGWIVPTRPGPSRPRSSCTACWGTCGSTT